MLAGLSGVTAIAAGGSHTVALKNDGTVVAWGDNFYGQTTVPVGLSGVTAIAAGGWHTVALKNDGTVVAWGRNIAGQRTVPAGLSGVVAIAAGYYHTAVLVAPTAPTITTQPLGQTVVAGTTATLTVAASGYPALSLQWRKNGVNIAGATNATLTLTRITSADAGIYTVTITNSSGSITSTASLLTVVVSGGTSSTARLANVSIRAGAGSGSETLIVGLTIGGAGTSGSKTLLIRGTGPALTAFGVTGALADPVLTVFNAAAAIAANDDWGDDAQVGAKGAALGAFPLIAGSKDAALVGTVSFGGYTVQLTGKAGATGVGLVEVYDATAGFTATTPRVINVSARTQVGTGGNILITGFVIAGGGTRQVLIRATGPALARFGVAGTLVDPKLELYNGAGVKTDENDNWSSTTRAAQTSIGAFPLVAGSNDSVIVVTLAPGSYTAQVSGVGATTGVALVEIYELP